VRINGELIGTRYRPTMNDTMKIAPIPREGVELEVTVESTGHINYGPYLGRDRKGIAGSVCLDLQAQFHWEYELMPLQDAPEEFGELPADGTAAGFRCVTFTVEGEPGDTFIEYPGIKGQVWVNGFNLGRYWDRGPSETLYVPAPVLKSGENRVVVMEWEKFTSDKVTFTSEPRLGIPEQG
jgi:beta-galactosidase